MRMSALCVLLASQIVGSPVATADNQPPAQVMLFGVFHFANPGRDVVKTDQIDVMTDENQAYLEALSNKLSKYNPTVVLLEFSPEREPEMQERFRQYVDGSYQLTSNEIYQLGFRIAARSDTDTIYGFDETNIHWQAQPMFEYLESNDASTEARMSAVFEELTAADQKAHASLSLQELLLRANDADRDAQNRALYMMTNHVGDEPRRGRRQLRWRRRGRELVASQLPDVRPGATTRAAWGTGSCNRWPRSHSNSTAVAFR